MLKLTARHSFITLFISLYLIMLSPKTFADEQASALVSSGWLVDFKHPPVAVQLQLTGEKDPQLNTVNAILQLQLQDDWKTYWRAPGDGGAAPHLDFSQSTNIRDVAWQWPAPTRYSIYGVDTLGYKGFIDFPITLYLHDPTQPAYLQGKLTIASCTSICVLSNYQINLHFNSEDLVINREAAQLYKQAMATVPTKVSQSTTSKQSPIIVSSSIWDKNQQQLVVEIENKQGWHSPDIFVDSATQAFTGVTFLAPEYTTNENKLTARIKVDSWDDTFDLNNQPLNLTVTDENLAVELFTSPGQKNMSTDAESLWAMFMVALIGGLILNIMPCVLPVLGMKLSSILTAQGINRLQIRKQFIASSAGILFSFWLLAAFLLFMKLSGQALGWGIQFQSPYFIGFMVVITALFAANMLDVFTIQLPIKTQTWLATKGSQSYLGHFLQGMFATLLATPCSAPFLGTAVAFSLAASSLQLFVIFSALGLGMALPWLLIAGFPSIALWLPKPGNWMNGLKTFFALLILITCYWLISLLGNFIGQSLMIVVALILTILLTILTAKKHSKQLSGIVLVTIIFAIIAGQVFTYMTENKGTDNSALTWQPLDTVAIEQQIKQGNVVFVDITADWCVTCKANKIGVLLQEPVYTRLQEDGIVAMRGDWTIASERVSQYLQSHGRVAVPFNIIYGPGAPQGMPLATILTSEAVLAGLEQAKGAL